jgi:ankyrin repeat protein
MRPHSTWPRILLCACLLLAPLISQAQSELADSIQNGRLTAALELMTEGTDVNAAQADGTTPLHWATYRLDRGLVERLLAAGADPSPSNDYGATPLAEAVKAADLELVEILLEAGADPDSPNGDGQTALMLAALTGVVDVAAALVEHGADINASEAWRDQTALMWAIDGGFVDLTRYLADHFRAACAVPSDRRHDAALVRGARRMHRLYPRRHRCRCCDRPTDARWCHGTHARY